MAKANANKTQTQSAVQFTRSSVANRIVQYRVRGTDTETLIAEARKQQEWVNRRIDALARKGIPKNATVGDVRKQSPAAIKTRYQAERAIARAKKIAANPLTNINNWNKLITAAEKEFGKGRRFKVIADPTNPRRPILVPYGTSGYNGRPTDPYQFVRDILTEFWVWYESIGQMYLDSDEAYQALSEALELGKDPIEYAEGQIEELRGTDLYSNYLKLYDNVYNTERTSEML